MEMWGGFLLFCGHVFYATEDITQFNAITENSLEYGVSIIW